MADEARISSRLSHTWKRQLRDVCPGYGSWRQDCMVHVPPCLSLPLKIAEAAYDHSTEREQA
jgi:hypothetical protein